jgi:hypothetical protein
MSAEVERILMPLRFILVLEALRAIQTNVLFLLLVFSKLLVRFKFLGLFGTAFTDLETRDSRYDILTRCG